MSLELELYEEKRRKLRRSSFIKGCAITATLMTIGLGFWNVDFMSSPHVASYQIEGEIYDDPQRDSILNDIAESENVYGLILHINSPGGSIVGAEALYHSLQNVKEKKPVVALIGEVGASAAYIAALAGDKVFARGNSLVGSIGVIFQYPDLSQLAETLGISLEVIKSSDAKGGPNLLKSMDKKSYKNHELLVYDSYMWFKGLVSDRRKIFGNDLEAVSQGELYTGRMALELNLIDGIGAQDLALEYLQSQGTKFSNIEIKDWSLRKTPKTFWNTIFGLSNLNYLRNKIKFIKRLSVNSINILFLHNPRNDFEDYEGVLDFMNKLKEDGRIKHKGISLAKNYNYDFQFLNEFDVIQDDGNLLDMRFLNFELSNDVKFMARSPLASGILSGKINKDSIFPPDDHRSGWLKDERLRSIMKRVDKINEVFDFELIDLAKEFIISNEKIDKVIFGVKSPEHIDRIVKNKSEFIFDNEIKEKLVGLYKNDFGLIGESHLAL